MIDWQVATKVGRGLVPIVKPPSVNETRAIVCGLRHAAAKCVSIIQDVTELPETGAVPELVVGRRDLVEANVATAKVLFESLETEATNPFAKASQAARGASLGAALALIVPRILGQYDPFGPRPALMLCAPTIYEVEQELRVDPGDFRLWVALHEQTHRVQFANAPWIRDHLMSLLAVLLKDEKNFDLNRLMQSRKSDPDEPKRPTSMALAAKMVSPESAKALDQVNAVMGLLEGHADFMMDAVGATVVPSVKVIRRRFQNRRQKKGWQQIFFKLMGMDAKMVQYRDGARFCRAVIDEVGVAGLNKVWESKENLPTLVELQAPLRWLNRIGYGS